MLTRDYYRLIRLNSNLFKPSSRLSTQSNVLSPFALLMRDVLFQLDFIISCFEIFLVLRVIMMNVLRSILFRVLVKFVIFYSFKVRGLKKIL